MKKKLLLALSLLMVAAMLFAAGQRGSSDTTLTVWDFKSGEEGSGKAFREIDRLFMQQNPGVTINRIAQPRDQYYQILTPALRAGTAPDVIMIHPDPRAWALQQFFLDLTPHIRDVRGTYSSAALRASSPTQNPNGDTKMLPLTAQGMGIYYNKQNFQRAGLNPNNPPRTWNEFLAACEALRRAGIDPIIFGTPHGVCFTYRVILATLYGAEGIEGFRNGRSNFTDPEFRLATQMIRELFDRNFINVEAGSISYFMDAIEMFKAGRGGFYPGLNSDIANWFDFGNALGGFQNVGYFSSPVHPTARFPNAQVNQGAGIGYAVNTNSRNTELAVKYAIFNTSGQGAKIFMDYTGAIVPNNSVPIDANNALLSQVLTAMNANPAGDFMQALPAGMSEDLLHPIQFRFFISREITIDEYIRQVQALYTNSLR